MTCDLAISRKPLSTPLNSEIAIMTEDAIKRADALLDFKLVPWKSIDALTHSLRMLSDQLDDGSNFGRVEAMSVSVAADILDKLAIPEKPVIEKAVQALNAAGWDWSSGSATPQMVVDTAYKAILYELLRLNAKARAEKVAWPEPTFDGWRDVWKINDLAYSENKDSAFLMARAVNGYRAASCPAQDWRHARRPKTEYWPSSEVWEIDEIGHAEREEVADLIADAILWHRTSETLIRKKTMSTLPKRPDYATLITDQERADKILQDALNAGPSKTQEAPQTVKSLVIFPRFRTVTKGKKSYDFYDTDIFTAENPVDYYSFPDDWPQDISGVFARVNDGIEKGDAFVFFRQYAMEHLMGVRAAKKKAMVAFADKNYDTFAQIIDDLNTAKSVVDYKPFVECGDAVFSTDNGSIRIYQYDFVA
jgi:hypothetical protein